MKIQYKYKKVKNKNGHLVIFRITFVIIWRKYVKYVKIKCAYHMCHHFDIKITLKPFIFIFVLSEDIHRDNQYYLGMFPNLGPGGMTENQFSNQICIKVLQTFLKISGTRNIEEPFWIFLTPEIFVYWRFLAQETGAFWRFLAYISGARNLQKASVSGARILQKMNISDS